MGLRYSAASRIMHRNALECRFRTTELKLFLPPRRSHPFGTPNLKIDHAHECALAAEFSGYAYRLLQVDASFTDAWISSQQSAGHRRGVLDRAIRAISPEDLTGTGRQRPSIDRADATSLKGFVGIKCCCCCCC